jgi:hypothetical protein
LNWGYKRSLLLTSTDFGELGTSQRPCHPIVWIQTTWVAKSKCHFANWRCETNSFAIVYNSCSICPVIELKSPGAWVRNFH